MIKLTSESTWPCHAVTQHKTGRARGAAVQFTTAAAPNHLSQSKSTLRHETLHMYAGLLRWLVNSISRSSHTSRISPSSIRSLKLRSWYRHGIINPCDSLHFSQGPAVLPTDHKLLLDLHAPNTLLVATILPGLVFD